MGVSLIILGWGLHLTSITLRGVATDRAPWGNMYEFVTLACAAGIGASLLMLRKPVLRPMWVFVLTPVLILMFIAGTLLYATAAPVVPALQSYWLLIHVSIVSVGSGVFLIPGWPACCSSFESATPTALPAVVASGSSRNGCRTRRSWIGWPTGQRSSRSHCSVAGVILGAIWAEAAWGRFWGWDPKETTSFIAWIVYAAYLHARATAGWRETKAAWINIAGFAAMLGNLFIINIVVSGLHSYAGLN